MNSIFSGPPCFPGKANGRPERQHRSPQPFCCIEFKLFWPSHFFKKKADARPNRPSQARATQWRWLPKTGAGNAQSGPGSAHHMHRERLGHSTVVTHAPSQTRPGFAQTGSGFQRPCCELTTDCRWQGQGMPKPGWSNVRNQALCMYFQTHVFLQTRSAFS